MTTDKKSVEIAAYEALTTPKFTASESAGLPRLFQFSYTTASDTDTDTLELARLPIGAEVVGYAFNHSALGTSCTFDIGVEDGTATSIANDLDVSALGNKSALIAPVSASGKAVYGTFDGANPDDDATINGYIIYIKGA